MATSKYKQGGVYQRRGGEAVVPHASNDLVYASSKLYVGGAGNIAMVMDDNTVLILTAVPVGTWIEGITFRRINAIGTTATLMIAFY